MIIRARTAFGGLVGVLLGLLLPLGAAADPFGNQQPLSCSMVVNACGSQAFTRSALGTPALLNGTGLPSSTLGAVNDYYVRTDTGGLYQKVAGTWAFKASFTGPTGPTGATGATGIAGATWTHNTGAPASGYGANGDFYLRDDTAQMYAKASGNWSVTVALVSLSGNNVYTGRQTWAAYSETPVSVAITSNTLTIDLSLGSVFVVASSANITTFTIINAQASYASAFTLIITANGTGYTQAWNSSGNVKAAGGVMPTLTTINAKIDRLAFATYNGTTWLLSVAGQNF